ncbi:7302_t:CDS:2, partial [Scutellospora calospora]
MYIFSIMSNSRGINNNEEENNNKGENPSKENTSYLEDSYNENEELSEQISFFNSHREASDNVTISSSIGYNNSDDKQ